MTEDQPPEGVSERRRAARRESDRLGLHIDGRRRADRLPAPPNRTPSARDEQRRLVLYLAAEPERLSWLRHHVAGHLARVAQALDAAGHPEAARIAHRAATDHRLGEVPTP